MNVSEAERDAVRKRAARFWTINLSLGIWAMLLSPGEGSTAWALYIWLAALQGVALGLLAGPGWSDTCLTARLLIDEQEVHFRDLLCPSFPSGDRFWRCSSLG